MVGVTKTIGDRFGSGGIADRMIWFSGYPFLDNKEEHVFNVPVSHAMTVNPLTLPMADFPVREAERVLREHKYQGFPIVENTRTKTLVGYIGRTELRYAIDRARSEGLLCASTQCTFTKEAAEMAVARRASGRVSRLAPENLDAIAESDGSSSVVVDFSRYVDHTALTVSPGLPLETVMEIFKKMGPRVILIEHRGQLVGLVTVKDCLRYQFTVEAQEQAPAAVSLGDVTREELTLEDKIWSSMQWLGDRLSLFRRPHPEHRMLDGTEQVDATVELQERSP